MTAVPITFTLSDVWAIESPLPVVAGETITFTCTFLGVVSATSESAKAYLNKSEVTSTVFPGGSTSHAGNTVTLKPATDFIGDKRYVIAVTVTLDGNVRVKKFKLICQKAEKEQ